MKNGPNSTDARVVLRRSAEQQLATQLDTAAIPGDETKLLHELQVHQIELEMLNENLSHAQAELEKSWACYYDLYELAPVGYLTVNNRDIILNANLTATKMLGSPRKALLKMTLNRFILAEDQDQYYLHRKQLMDTGTPQTCELRVVSQNAPFLWIRVQMNRLLDADGDQVFRVVLIDISELKQIESELRESDERLELALTGSGLVLWDWNIPERKVTAGKRWFELLGYTNQELDNHKDGWMALVNPKDFESFTQKLSAHLLGETASFESEHQLRHKEGYWVTVEAKGKITRQDEDGLPVRMVGTIQNVTQRKRLHDEGTHLLNQIEALIRESTSRSPGKAEADNRVESLTRRQKQIMGMIANGMTSLEIGQQLHLSTATVISHRRNLMANLNIHSTAEITRFAIKHGLL